MSDRSSANPIADRRHAYAMAYRDAGDLVAAAEVMAQALELAPGWAAGWLALGEILEGTGDQDGAIDAYGRALDLDAADEAGAAARLARLGAHPVGGALSPAHVAALFDDYAPSFEAALVERLLYRAPALLRDALGTCRSPLAFRRMIDLGCGTGLMGEAMANACSVMDGIDLSAGMLAAAIRKGLYARLTRSEVVAYLDGEPGGGADLILAADVLVYLGDLAPLFRAVARVLEPGGLFGFTVQELAPKAPPGASGAVEDVPAFALGEDLRYAHGEAGIGAWAAAAGLAVVRLERASTRLDAGVPVPGLVAILEKRGG